MTWTQHQGLMHGDIITFEGRYSRRTFWQFLTGRPRELKRFMIIDPRTDYTNTISQLCGPMGRL